MVAWGLCYKTKVGHSEEGDTPTSALQINCKQGDINMRQPGPAESRETPVCTVPGTSVSSLGFVGLVAETQISRSAGRGGMQHGKAVETNRPDSAQLYDSKNMGLKTDHQVAHTAVLQ